MKRWVTAISPHPPRCGQLFLHVLLSQIGTPKLRLKITKEDKKLTVQVLEQDERFRRKPDGGFLEYAARNRCRILSNCSRFTSCATLRAPRTSTA
jgi:hypothetical protein